MERLPASSCLLSSLTDDERLYFLQQNDPLREWHSVDDARICMCCGRRITGRLIQIWHDGEKVWFRCPTSSCGGTLPDFGRAGDPFLDEEIWTDWSKSFDPDDHQELDRAS